MQGHFGLIPQGNKTIEVVVMEVLLTQFVPHMFDWIELKGRVAKVTASCFHVTNHPIDTISFLPGFAKLTNFYQEFDYAVCL